MQKPLRIWMIVLSSVGILSACSAPTKSPLQYMPEIRSSTKMSKVNAALGKVVLGYTPGNKHEGEMVRKALQNILAESNMFDQSADVSLDVELRDLIWKVVPAVLVNDTTRTNMTYVVKTSVGAPIFQTSISAVGTVEFSKVPAGPERISRAFRKSVSSNYSKFVEELSTYFALNSKKIEIAAGQLSKSQASRNMSPSTKRVGKIASAAPRPDQPRASRFNFSISSPRPNDIAVIVANSNYKKQGKDIPNVDPAYTDAEGFKQWVTQAKGVREGNIIYLEDATSAQMVNAFGGDRSHKGQLFNWAKPGISNVYIYYAGHGAPAGDDGSAYLVPSDTNSATVQLTGYPLTTLYKNLRMLPAKSITVVLEACFSGASQNGNVISRTSGLYVSPKLPITPSNITVISAGRADQVASWEQDSSQSLFTKYFLTGMSGEADKLPYGNSDGDVSYPELGKYLEGTMTYFVRRYYGRDQNAQIVVKAR